MINVAVYDVNLLNHKNYIGDLLAEFIRLGVKVYAFYDEYNEEAYEFLNDLGVETLQLKSVNEKSIKLLYQQNAIDILIHNAQRLGDSAFVTVAKSLKIPTCMIQHGMYVPHLKRQKTLFLAKFIKTIRYILYVKVISKSISKPFSQTFKSFYNHFVKNIDYTVAIPFYSAVNSDRVLTYGQYWSNYHVENFGYNKKQLNVIGYHELKNLESFSNLNCIDNAYTYVAQTLVEDGRLEKSVLLDFLSKLDIYAHENNIKILVKLHPRSDVGLYDFSSFSLFKDEVPLTEAYIGHYSSLLALVNRVAPVFLYEFEGHPIPECFRYNSVVFDDFKMLKSKCAINIEGCKFSNPDDIFSNSYNEKTVAEDIIDYAKNR